MYNGALILNKPEGFTSHDAVAKLRGIFRQRKVGHGGTLDPMATGVLPVFFGNATRAVSYAVDAEKEYVATFRLGMTTDTQDRTGKTLSVLPVCADRAAVQEALSAFVGEIDQIPPMYSAIQKDGQRLYDLARKGVEVEREPRSVFIRSLTLLPSEPAENTYSIRVVCSKGTYIRTLCHDLGLRLGCGAVMTALTRIRVGAFSLEQAVNFDVLSCAASENRLAQMLVPTDGLFAHMPAVVAEEKWTVRARNGGRFPDPREEKQDAGPVRVYDTEGNFIMLASKGRNEDIGFLVPEKMFWSEPATAVYGKKAPDEREKETAE